MGASACLLGRKHHQHLATFHARIGLDLGDFGNVVLNALEQVHAELLVRELAAAERLVGEKYGNPQWTDDFA